MPRWEMRGDLKDGRTGSSLQGGAGNASAAPPHLFPTVSGGKREWERSPARHRGGVRCSSLPRHDMEAIYSSRECKQTVRAPSSPSAIPSRHWLWDTLFPTEIRPPARTVPASAQTARLQRGQVAAGWGLSLGQLSSPGSPAAAGG